MDWYCTRCGCDVKLDDGCHCGGFVWSTMTPRPTIARSDTCPEAVTRARRVCEGGTSSQSR